MQFFSAKPLVEKFKAGAFEEREVAPYFLADVLLRAFFAIPVGLHSVSKGEFRGDVIEGVGCLIVTMIGVFYLKRKNGNSFGNGFLGKFFALGWVVNVRLFFIGIPVLAVACVLVALAGGTQAIDGVWPLLMIAGQAAYYWWVGGLIRETREQPEISSQAIMTAAGEVSQSF